MAGFYGYGLDDGKNINDARYVRMDPWQIFSELCRRVVEEQNVYLEVTIHGDYISMELWPYNDEDLEGDDE